MSGSAIEPEPRPLRALLELLRPHRRRLVAATLFQVLKDSPVWLVPVFTARIIDVMVSRGSPTLLLFYVGITVLVLAQNYPTHLLYVRMYSKVYRSVAADLRNTLADHLQGLSIGFHSRRSAALIQTKIVRDVENIELVMQQVSPVAGVSASILIGSIVITAIQVPVFLLVFLVTVPIAAGLVASMRARVARRNEEFRLRMEELSTEVGEMAMLIPITRAHGLEATATRRVRGTAENVRLAGMELDRLNSRFETTSWVSFQVLSVLCLGLASLAALSGIIDITAGQVVLLSTYFATLTSAVIQLVSLTPVISKGLESVQSITEVMRDPDVEANAGKVVVDDISGAVTFHGVSLTYPEADRAAIRNVDLQIAAGETIAFVGASGSGKSTMLNLVLGFVRPTSGEIRFDGRDIETLDMRTLRRHVSVVPQESVLFDGSIYDNVAYGMDHVTPEQMRRALEQANATDIVDQLPEGWSTRVGPRGARLSGGQRQRLAIARALVRNPRILLLDEATSALDTESEAKVQQALGVLMAGRTALVVAHRLSTIRSADRIVVMQSGEIVEIGSHDELLVVDGHYARMHRAQSR